MKQLAKRVMSPGEGNKKRQLKRNAGLLQILKAHSKKLLKLEADDLGITSMKDYGFSRVYSMPFDKFKTFFNPQLQDHKGISEVVLKIYDPKNMKSERPGYAIDDYGYSFEYATQTMIELSQKEVKAYKQIEDYNKKVKNKNLKVKVPKLLDYGAVVIFDCLGSIWLIGLYIVFSKIKFTRPFLKKDIPKLKTQVELLNNGAYIEHRDLALRNIIVNGDDVYLIDFDLARDLRDRRASYRETSDAARCDGIIDNDGDN